MRRVIGIDIHRTFGEVVIWEDGRLRNFGRVDMTRTALEGLGGKLFPTDEVVIEATGNCMAVSRVLSPFVKRVVIANPLQVKAIAHAHVKTDKVDAGTLANLFAAGYLPEIWTPTTSRRCWIRSCNWPAGRTQLRPLCRSLESASAERRGARAPQSGKERIGRLAALAADAPRFATRSLAHAMNSMSGQKPLVHLIRRMDLRPVVGRESHVGEHVGPRPRP